MVLCTCSQVVCPGNSPKGGATANKEVDMGNKHIEFGKDIGLMAQVVARGLSLGIGHWELWEALSKHRPGLWSEVLQFIEQEASASFEPWPRKRSQQQLCREPDIETLDKAVRQGREYGFGKREWTLLAESPQIFRALVNYLMLAPPFSVELEVCYDQLPPYVGGYTPGYQAPKKNGFHMCEMSIYQATDEEGLSEVEACISQKGWRFGDQHEVYDFGQFTKRHIRPWALMGTNAVYAPGSISESQGYRHFPRLWMLRGNDELDPNGCVEAGGRLRADFRILIVKK